MYYVLAASSLYTFWIAFAMKTSNMASAFFFKFLPFAFAMAQAVIAAKHFQII